MNNLSEAIFKITAILLITYGMSSFVELVASLKMIPEDESIETPALLYWSKLIPLVMGVVIWLLIPKLMTSAIVSKEEVSSQTIVSTGCFLIGLFLVANLLPNFIYALIEYKKISSIQYIGESMASSQVGNLLIIGSRFLIGLLLILFSARIGMLYIFLGKRHK